MDGINRPEERLENILSVDPILSALRSVSQASMQSARRQLSTVERYGNDLFELTAWLPRNVPGLGSGEEEAQPRTLIIALGSDRGLCGTFNSELAEELLNQQRKLKSLLREFETWVLGLRLNTALDHVGIHPDRAERFARGSIPEFQKVHRLSQMMLEKYQQGHFDRAVVLFNQHRRGGRFSTALKQLLPMNQEELREQAEEDAWPPPIIETDPERLLRRLLIQAVEINLFSYMLASSEAEHVTRFHILEDAAQNTDRLIEELQMEVQLARQQAITTEMLDLVAAAGLIKS